MKKQTIVLTGGHAVTTAIATIQALQKNKQTASHNLVWIGAKRDVEEKMLSTLAIPLHTVTVGKLHRKFTKESIPSLLKVPVGFWQSFWLLRKISPSLIVSFGGNVGLTICFSGWLLRIPIIVHEQTVAAGLANRISAYFAKIIALARQSSTRHFPKHKTILVGNPIVQQILEVPRKAKKSKKPVVLITGGSRGAHIINNVVDEILQKLLEEYSVIHLTGELEFDHFKNHKLVGYDVYSSVSPMEMARLYKQSDIVVSRAGANTVSEIMTIVRPAIFIPIPWVQQNEQMKNAQVAESTGLAIIIKQRKLTPELLLKKLNLLSKSWQERVNNFHLPAGIPNDRNAADQLVDLVIKLLPAQ